MEFCGSVFFKLNCEEKKTTDYLKIQMDIKYKIVAALMLWSLVVFSQNELDVPIDLSLRNVSIEEVLNEITSLKSLEFSYSKNLLPVKKIPVFEKKETSVKKVLDDLLFSRKLDYKLIGNQIVIFKNQKPKILEPYTINGFIEDATSGERLIGATILELNSSKGTSSNRYGFFSLTLNEEVPKIYINYVGYKVFVIENENKKGELLTIKLEPNLTLGEVVVLSSQYREKEKLKLLEIDLNEMEMLPAVLGETDLLRTINTLSGVQSGAEGIGGLHVRGGNFDQNLILLDDAPIYNPIHTWGAYSIFNSSAIQRARVFKSAFPARYGGRLSSVIDVQTKDGNKFKKEHEVELGIMSIKASTEGPILKEKASYFVSFRRSTTDFVDVVPYNRLFDGRESSINQNLDYYFYDVNAKLNYSFNKRNRLQLSFYQGRDDFEDRFESRDLLGDSTIYFSSDLSQDWGNRIASFRWNRTISEKLFSNVTATYSRYDYKSRGKKINRVEEYNLTESNITGYNSNIEDKSLKIDLDYYHSPERTTRFGARFTEYLFQPGIFNEIIGLSESADPDSLQQRLDTLWQAAEMRPRELSFYGENEFVFSEKGLFSFGINSSLFMPDGKFWFSFDPRIRIEWNQNENLSFGADAQRITQFTHLISPNRLGLPNDIWVSSTDAVAPQTAGQATAWIKGKPLKYTKIGVEAYYKSMKNLNEFSAERSGVLNAEDWENEIVTGTGRAYGVEMDWEQGFRFFKSKINYTYASSTRVFAGINAGDTFRFRYDRRHVVNASFFKKINKKWNVSASFVFGTELATTLPRGQYTFPGFGWPIQILVVGRRNEDGIPAFHHLDIGADYSWKRSKIKFGIHNIYLRKNIVFYEFGKDNAFNQRAMPPILPALSYNLKI